ncbi:MAG: hypothetical protein QNI99_02210 [Woeseiaceae bacterium]|nr:hypothetical protein [Woeseiaceae bacterium]
MTRNQISGLIGLIIGLGLCVLFYVIAPSPEEFSVPWIALILIVLGVYYLFFKKEPADEVPDIDPADRVRKFDKDQAETRDDS